MIKNFPFLGVWRGNGVVLPEIAYEEELSLEVFGTPVAKQIRFASKTWRAGGNYEESPMHTEFGMMKVMFRDENNAAVELLLSHPFGMTEIETGEYTNGALELRTFNISRSPTASNAIVEGIRRRFWLENNTLRYELFLKLIGREEYLHLQANLVKQ